MRKFILFFIATLSLSTLFSQNVYALSCVEPNISEWMNNFDAAIVATVTDVKDGIINNEKVPVVNAVVKESYKGVDSKNITFLDSVIWPSSNVGQTYIYFLIRDDNNHWLSSTCTTIALREGDEAGNAFYHELQQYPKLKLLTHNVGLKTNENIQHKQQTEASLFSNYIISPIVWLLGIICLCCLIVVILLVRRRK